MKFIAALILLTSTMFAQYADISRYLKQIESGSIKDALVFVNANKNKIDPNIYYLSAKITEDPETAIELYDKIVKNFPSSNYADEAKDLLENYYIVTGKKNSSTIKYEPTTQQLHYTIQAGAFSIKENALKLKNELEKENLIVDITSKEVKGVKLTVVNVGRYAEQKDALPIIDKLKNKYKLSPVLVLINK